MRSERNWEMNDVGTMHDDDDDESMCKNNDDESPA